MPTITTHKKSCDSKPFSQKTEKPIGSPINSKNKYCQFTHSVEESNESAEYWNSYTEVGSDLDVSTGYWTSLSDQNLKLILEEEDNFITNAMLEMTSTTIERFKHMTQW